MATLEETMKLEDYKSGVYLAQYAYKSFSPSRINRQWVWEDAKVNTLLAEANRKLGSLDSFAQQVPDIDLFIETHIAKEAAQSSRIEGTRTEIEEAFVSEASVAPERINDWQEVRNYIEAINSSIENLANLPVSTRMLKDAHKILMRGVRGENKNPGEFRTSQNWIGGATLQDAVYIPPAHTEIDGLISDLEKFLHNDKIDVPVLIRAAIAHYQFESIHPFLDGNGRIGRLLIILYLVSTKLLTKPALYLSDYFERNRILYYDNLNRVRTHNDMIQWIKFFLAGIIQTSEHGIDTFRKILTQKEVIEETLLPALGKKLPRARLLLKMLYKKPVITVQEVQEEMGVSLPTANALVADFTKLKILQEKTGYARNRQFEFSGYLDLFRRG